MSNFFPLNEDVFVEFTIRDWRAAGYDWTDILQANIKIDNQVSNNSNEENNMIVNEYAGGLFEAVEMYKEQYDGFDYNSKQDFYAKLAYISIYHKFYDIIRDKIENEINEDNE